MDNWLTVYGLSAICIAMQFSSSRAGFLERNYPPSVSEDAHMTTYPNEAHFVTTSDNYILGMHRIPRPGAQPVLLVHGILDSSATWIMMGPQSGLAYYLYDSGYDVWMGNSRGNTYSRNHTSLDPNEDSAFWNFSWHEMGIYDLPAMIDTVLNVTRFAKLTYYGHSQGSTSFFVMASKLPEYNDKVHLMNGFTPVAFLGHMKTPTFHLIITKVLIFTGSNEAIELYRHSHDNMHICLLSVLSMRFCLYYLFSAIGNNERELNKTMIPVIFGHLPAGCSTLQIKHYLQLTRSGRFHAFDYGAKINRRIYGRLDPPDYPIGRITAPIALYYTHNDPISVPEDVQRLANQLPNVVVNHLYSNPKWNHLDIMWGASMRFRTHPHILAISRQFEKTIENEHSFDLRI
ncbi:lipase 1-like isoform X2 [Scaptodrosophila lebanonensis]|uniref:Lipase n=1 Tax=Drosophila lebanonensis TaxID=7225 RepID=A0A6J2U6M9_DROLE|nr:lipase 1-like isoform X2 [Scaptodrosophila lebanonensis]